MLQIRRQLMHSSYGSSPDRRDNNGSIFQTWFLAIRIYSLKFAVKGECGLATISYILCPLTSAASRDTLYALLTYCKLHQWKFLHFKSRNAETSTDTISDKFLYWRCQVSRKAYKLATLCVAAGVCVIWMTAVLSGRQS